MEKHTTEKISARAAWTLQRAASAVGLQVTMRDFYPQLDSDDRDAMVSIEQHAACIRYLYNQPVEAIGLKIGAHLPIDGWGLWGLLMRSSPTFGELLRRLIRYRRVISTLSDLHVDHRGDEVAIVCTHPDPSPFGPRQELVFASLAHCVALGRKLSGQPIEPLAVSCRTAQPRNTKPYTDFFQCALSFSATEDCILFNRQTLDTPLRDAAPELQMELERLTTELIEQLVEGHTLIARVRTAIEYGLSSGKLNETIVAGQLAMTPRTLHRQLRRLNTSFRVLREHALQQRAQLLLRQPAIPLSVVAHDLGYSEPATFYRAFKRWTGSPPGAWRAHCGTC